MQVYLTADCHGQFGHLLKFNRKQKLTEEDVIIILGDSGINYYPNDTEYKNFLIDLPCKILCIHGNHEYRANKLPQYKETIYFDGKVYQEANYPNILFAKDGEIYNINGNKCMVIGGAYSVDKYYRLSRGYSWHEDEQPDEQIKNRCIKQLNNNNWTIDYMFTHTCPFNYEPKEWFLSGLDQKTVDTSTESWLQSIHNKLDFKIWYCGHFHGSKYDEKGKIRFVYHDFVELGNK